MKETDYKVKIKLPTATEVKKLEKKSLVSYIYVGAPLASYQSKYGTEPRVQLNDKISNLVDIPDYVESEHREGYAFVPCGWIDGNGLFMRLMGRRLSNNTLKYRGGLLGNPLHGALKVNELA